MSETRFINILSKALNFNAKLPPEVEAQALNAYMHSRSLLYTAESLFIPTIEWLTTKKRPRTPFDDKELFLKSRQHLADLFKQDIQNINDGLYPISVLKPRSPIKHLVRIPKLFSEGLKSAKRKQDKNSTHFEEQAYNYLENVPEYYRRNFHFQSSGYLSDKSAEIYEHQVDVLFSGAADSMRRLFLKPMKDHFQNSDGFGLKILEIGCGTGRATRFLKLAFPKAHIVALDLSAPYLKQARHDLKEFDRIDFVEADAAHVPYPDQHFDAVVSVFMHHELPQDVRKEILLESKRLLKPGGCIAAVDSLQLDDHPELNSALEQFPIDYHEPYYKNYIQNPLRDLFEQDALRVAVEQTGFFSKVILGVPRP